MLVAMLFWPYTGADILVQTLDEGSCERQVVGTLLVLCCQRGGPYVLPFEERRPQWVKVAVVVREKG